MKWVKFFYLWFKLPLLIACLSGCGSSYLYYTTINSNDQPETVGSALLENRIPPSNANQSNVSIDVQGTEDWRLDALAASPTSGFLSLGFIDINNPVSDSNGKLEIYRNFGGALVFSYDDDDLKNMIIQASDDDVTYPDSVYAFHPYRLGYQDDNTLMVHIQPQSTGGSPLSNVELKISLNNGAVDGSAVFFNRGAQRPMPVHPENNRYNFSVVNGVMQLDGQVVDGIPGNLAKTLHDQTVVGQ